MKKITLEIDLDTADTVLEQAMKSDADILWEYVGQGCQDSYVTLEALKVYMEYCGVEWVPEQDTDGMVTL